MCGLNTSFLSLQTQSSYSLVVEAKDRGGELGGNAATSSLEIKILDVNDNLPVVQSSSVSLGITVWHVPTPACIPLLKMCRCRLPCTGERR